MGVGLLTKDRLRRQVARLGKPLGNPHKKLHFALRFGSNCGGCTMQIKSVFTQRLTVIRHVDQCRIYIAKGIKLRDQISNQIVRIADRVVIGVIQGLLRTARHLNCITDRGKILKLLRIFAIISRAMTAGLCRVTKTRALSACSIKSPKCQFKSASDPPSGQGAAAQASKISARFWYRCTSIGGGSELLNQKIVAIPWHLR